MDEEELDIPKMLKEPTNKQKWFLQIMTALITGVVLMIILSSWIEDRLTKTALFIILIVIIAYLKARYLYPKLGWSIEK